MFQLRILTPTQSMKERMKAEFGGNLATVPGNPIAVTVMMSRNPTLISPVRLYPFPVFVMVALDPDLPAGRPRAHVNGGKDGQKGQRDSKNQ
jgi:hypothetical protein